MSALSRIACASGLVAASLVIFSAAPVSAEILNETELTSLLENAATHEDHMKLADHYAAQAEKLRQDSARHGAMSEKYTKMPPRARASSRGMMKHCERLAASLGKAAKSADELAVGHRQMAKDGK